MKTPRRLSSPVVAPVTARLACEMCHKLSVYKRIAVLIIMPICLIWAQQTHPKSSPKDAAAVLPTDRSHHAHAATEARRPPRDVIETR